MEQRFITLADGRRIGLGSYVKAWRKCRDLVLKGHGSEWIGRGVGGWGQNAGQALDDLRRAMDERINSGIPRSAAWSRPVKPAWRKLDPDWQSDMRRAARSLNSRYVIHWLPADLRTRFADRIA